MSSLLDSLVLGGLSQSAQSGENRRQQADRMAELEQRRRWAQEDLDTAARLEEARRAKPLDVGELTGGAPGVPPQGLSGGYARPMAPPPPQQPPQGAQAPTAGQIAVQSTAPGRNLPPYYLARPDAPSQSPPTGWQSAETQPYGTDMMRMLLAQQGGAQQPGGMMQNFPPQAPQATPEDINALMLARREQMAPPPGPAPIPQGAPEPQRMFQQPAPAQAAPQADNPAGDTGLGAPQQAPGGGLIFPIYQGPGMPTIFAHPKTVGQLEALKSMYGVSKEMQDIAKTQQATEQAMHEQAIARETYAREQTDREAQREYLGQKFPAMKSIIDRMDGTGLGKLWATLSEQEKHGFALEQEKAEQKGRVALKRMDVEQRRLDRESREKIAGMRIGEAAKKAEAKAQGIEAKFAIPGKWHDPRIQAPTALRKTYDTISVGNTRLRTAGERIIEAVKNASVTGQAIPGEVRAKLIADLHEATNAVRIQGEYGAPQAHEVKLMKELLGNPTNWVSALQNQTQFGETVSRISELINLGKSVEDQVGARAGYSDWNITVTNRATGQTKQVRKDVLEEKLRDPKWAQQFYAENTAQDPHAQEVTIHFEAPQPEAQYQQQLE